jgi:hypothetical protein
MAGKPITHAKLILNLLKAVLLPKTVAICKCESAYEETKRVVRKQHPYTESHLKEEVSIDTELLKESQLRAPIKEVTRWVKMGAADKGGIWHKGYLPILPKLRFK